VYQVKKLENSNSTEIKLINSLYKSKKLNFQSVFKCLFEPFQFDFKICYSNKTNKLLTKTTQHEKPTILIALVLTTSLPLLKSAPASASTFAGSADAYYKYDFSGIDNSLTSFTNSHNSFELGMASIEASHKMDKASVLLI
jgi:hypothetical protein